MKLFKILLSIAILLSALSCSDDSGTASETGTITGTVLNAITQAPIGGANIVTDPPTESVITNQQGEYTLKNVSVGNYTITFSKVGYNAKQIVVNVKANSTTDADVLLLPLGGDNLPPNPPFNPYPEHLSKIKTTDALLSWECDDPNNDSLNYDIYFDKMNPPVNLLTSNLRKSSYSISELLDSTTYYWRVVARDKWGDTASSVIWKFNVDLEDNPKPDEGLIAWWPFDGDALDKSGYNRHGTLMNQYQFIGGIRGQALRLIGQGANTSNGGHVLIPFIDFRQMPTFTISMWVNLESFTVNHGGPYIHFGDRAQGWLGISNHVKKATSQPLYIAFAVGAIDYQVEPIYYEFDQNDIGKWVMYTLVYSGGLMSAYINDELIGSKQQSIYLMGNNAGIARSWWYETNYETATRFTGTIDDVRIYNKALNISKIRSLLFQ